MNRSHTSAKFPEPQQEGVEVRERAECETNTTVVPIEDLHVRHR